MVTGNQRSMTERPKDMSSWYDPAMAASGDGQRFFVPTTGEQRPDAVNCSYVRGHLRYWVLGSARRSGSTEIGPAACGAGAQVTRAESRAPAQRGAMAEVVSVVVHLRRGGIDPGSFVVTHADGQ